MPEPGGAVLDVPAEAAAAFPGLHEQLAEYVGGGQALGVAVQIEHLSGRRYRLAGWQPGLGYRLRPESTFRWFCAVKTLLALTTLTLLRDNGLTADVPLHELLPEYAGGGREAIRVIHLLRHTSGLPSFPESAPGLTLEEAALATALPADAEPGGPTAYNICTAWMLLAAAVRRLTGLEMADAVRRLVFDPLGLTEPALRAPAGDPARLAARAARLVNPQAPGQRRFAVLTSPAVLNSLPAWIGGVGTLGDLTAVFAHLLRVRRGQGPDDERETVLDVTGRSGGREYDSTLGRPVAYARGTMVDISTAGFGRGWSADSFGVGGSIDKKVVIAAWADPRREIACGLALPGVSNLNSTQLFRLGERIASDVDAGAFGAAVAS